MFERQFVKKESMQQFVVFDKDLTTVDYVVCFVDSISISSAYDRSPSSDAAFSSTC